MRTDSIFKKILIIAAIGGICFIASLFVLGLVAERQNRFVNVQQDIAGTWGNRQVLIGPMLVGTDPAQTGETYVLPETLAYEVTLEPEVKSRGIFKTVVYSSTVNVSGEFLREEVRKAFAGTNGGAMFSVAITDTRGIEKQFDVTWDDKEYAFLPGSGTAFEGNAGLHATVPIGQGSANIPFSFTVQLKGSGGISVAPLGKETSIKANSSWTSPKFVGAFLPSQHEITKSGFTAEWKISSFGRAYPQAGDDAIILPQQVVNSAAGVDLYERIDAYDMIFRSIKYAILFIIVTFAAFFLFDVLLKIQVHPIQYFLVGSALALFYLLVLALSEQIGFPAAYLVATAMVAVLIAAYSSFVLKSRKRAVPIFALLCVLYGYLYFVLQLEDYALLFGSLLLFVLLTVLMYATRRTDWFSLGRDV